MYLVFFLVFDANTLIDKKDYGLGIAGQASLFGIQHIDVFNKTDLKMSENWFTLEILNKKNNEEMIPFYNVDGSRGAYHKSIGYTLGTVWPGEEILNLLIMKIPVVYIIKVI